MLLLNAPLFPDSDEGFIDMMRKTTTHSFGMVHGSASKNDPLFTNP
jgi:hypothetical protein